VALVFITGPTAAGKSTVRSELARRGFEAHDADEDGISSFFSRVSGERVEYPEDANDRTHEWLAMHEFLMSRQRVEELRAQASGKRVFLCGIPVNALGMADLFDKIICLVIDEATMLDRVAARTPNPFGKAPAERELILRSREPTIEAYRRSGALMIDGAQPIAGVLEEVLAVAVSDKPRS
jgi:dephospho-CoA kinase